MAKQNLDLEEIAEQLNPDKINEKVGIKHREARNKFKIKNLKTPDYETFRKSVISYIKHHWKETYKGEISDEMAWQKAREHMVNDSGKQDMPSFYKLARNGKFDDVIRQIAQGMEQDETTAYTAHIMEQIDPFDFDTHVKLVKQYQEKYKTILPKEVAMKRPEELARDYAGLIHSHAHLVHGLRENLEKYKSKKGSKEKD